MNYVDTQDFMINLILSYYHEIRRYVPISGLLL